MFTVSVLRKECSRRAERTISAFTVLEGEHGQKGCNSLVLQPSTRTDKVGGVYCTHEACLIRL